MKKISAILLLFIVLYSCLSTDVNKDLLAGVESGNLEVGFQVLVFVCMIMIMMCSFDGLHKSHIHGTKMGKIKITIFNLIMMISICMNKLPSVRDSWHQY